MHGGGPQRERAQVFGGVLGNVLVLGVKETHSEPTQRLVHGVLVGEHGVAVEQHERRPKAAVQGAPRPVFEGVEHEARFAQRLQPGLVVALGEKVGRVEHHHDRRPRLPGQRACIAPVVGKLDPRRLPRDLAEICACLLR